MEISETCDWSSLMTTTFPFKDNNGNNNNETTRKEKSTSTLLFDDNDNNNNKKKKKNDNTFTGDDSKTKKKDKDSILFLKKQQKYSTVLDRVKKLSLLNEFQITIIASRLEHFDIKTYIIYEKKKSTVDQLGLRGRDVYNSIIKELNTDDKIMHIHNLIYRGHDFLKKYSGRTIDTLTTRFQRYRNTCYYIDTTNKQNPVYCDTVTNEQLKSGNLIFFDIGESYRQKMAQYSKTYFDCFGRGYRVLHTLQSGKTLYLSLCQYVFFIWASKFLVFHFLEKNLADIVTIRQMTQKNSYKPKKFRRTNKKRKFIKIDVTKTYQLPIINLRRQKVKKTILDNKSIQSNEKIYQMVTKNWNADIDNSHLRVRSFSINYKFHK